ncbi:hypothetical protein H4Q32_024283 [Labeo rohita]|uniref:Uncharacterized protein n=1 Tax=Labeo rohita TaxID=84645 RepID=A0ABQ8LYG0_LABRO|nr:hypothetical protein H4Q32_024283 [Labeo rohita]
MAVRISGLSAQQRDFIPATSRRQCAEVKSVFVDRRSPLLKAVIDTQARAPSTKQAYALSWSRDSPSTAAYHDVVDGLPLGRHHLIVRFLRGAGSLNPPRLHLIPSWDLSVVLAGLQRDPFEPLESVELKYLSLKTLLPIALTSIKRVGDLHAFSVNESCLEFGPADSHVTLRLQPGYVPKVPTTPFRDQVVNLQALPLEEADPALALLCPIRALCIYVDCTRSFRRSEQLFVCFGGQQKGNAVSKQRLAHWVVDAITLAYQCHVEPCPLGVRAHSTRSVASSWALVHGTSLADICKIKVIAGGRLGVGLLRHSIRICAPSPVVPLGELWVLHALQFELGGVVRYCAEYNCTLKEGTETLRPSCHNPELRWRCRIRGDWAPKGDPKYVSIDVTSLFPPSGNEGYSFNRDVSYVTVVPRGNETLRRKRYGNEMPTPPDFQIPA